MLNRQTHQFIECKYDKDHWSLDNTKEGTCLTFIKFKNKYNYAIKLNPTDKRGYRALITFIGEDNTDIQTAFNRPYTAAEQLGLSNATSFMIEIYKKLGLPIVQTAQAGNNSQSLMDSGITQIGNEKEPSMLHTHIWGRGNPNHDFISGVPLDGPKPGEMFDMMAKTPSIMGNEKKIKWGAKQLELALQTFKTILKDYTQSIEYKEIFGDILEINIYELEKINKNTITSLDTSTIFSQHLNLDKFIHNENNASSLKLN